MRTSKHILLTVVLVLLSGLGTGAIAQRKAGASIRLPPEPIGTEVKVNAIEVTDGTLGFDSQTKGEIAFGYTFLGRTTGAFPGSFTLSMNCAPATATPGGRSAMTGGAWTLPVYMTEIRTGYAGSLYGTIANGEMTWDKTGTSANVYFVLNVDGGTQSYAGATGFATFAGTLFVGEDKGQKTTLTGDLVFNIISATAE